MVKIEEKVDEQYRYDAVLGYNTKQWWLYDNETDEYVDPPISVLDELKGMPSATADDISAQGSRLEEIASEEPTWLLDTDYRYSAEDTDI